ncbi:hypothetical protein PG996_011340 [Apiospora saccharicola]|uniref:Uncharacterized protein n=1 Tax=Apiospora saccharicola TaxID=335842 RepID=A0ABR1UES1_9PEZI
MSAAVQYPFPGMHSPTTASSKPVLPPSYHSPRDFEKLAVMQAQQHQAQYNVSNGATGGRPVTSAASKFDSHDDFYDFLDSNRGGSGAAAAAAAERKPPLATAHPHQRPRPEPPARHARRRRCPDAVTAPSYGSGSRSEEMLVDKHREQREKERRQQQIREQQLAQQQAHQQGASPAGARKPLPGGPRSPSSDSPSANAPWRGGSGAHPPQAPPAAQRQQEARPVSSDSNSSDGRPLARNNTAAGAAMGAAIQRLKSPSVMDCVLSPLESKVTEYLGFMTSEEDTISQLESEIALLQARKAEAESRHAEFKSKHDDYRRQYADVERALRGDAPPVPAPLPGMRHAATATSTNGPPTTRELQQQQALLNQQQQAQGGQAGSPAMGRPSTHNPQHDNRHMDDDMDEDDYDDEDDGYQNRRPESRRIMSQQSFGRSSQQGKKSRFRFSLFGGDK